MTKKHIIPNIQKELKAINNQMNALCNPYNKKIEKIVAEFEKLIGLPDVNISYEKHNQSFIITAIFTRLEKKKKNARNQIYAKFRIHFNINGTCSFSGCNIYDLNKESNRWIGSNKKMSSDDLFNKASVIRDFLLFKN